MAIVKDIKNLVPTEGPGIKSGQNLTQKLKVNSGLAMTIYDQAKKTGLLIKVDEHSLVHEKCLHRALKNMKSQGSQKHDLVIKIIEGLQGSLLAHQAILQLKKFELSVQAKVNAKSESFLVQFDSQTGEVRWKAKNLIKLPQNLQKENAKIKILIVDDSKTVRMLLRRTIETNQKEFEIIGEAADAFEAESIMLKTPPDVITLDLNMPKKDGLTFLKEYIVKHPIPTIIISDCTLAETGPVMDCLEEGAFEYLKKPAPENFQDFGRDLFDMLRAAAQSGLNQQARAQTSRSRPIRMDKSSLKISHSIISQSLVLIGASTGGTEAIKDILMGLDKDIPPILIVQHMPPVFTASFAERLSRLCPFKVKEAEDQEFIRPGTVYIAPRGLHMRIKSRGDTMRIELTEDPPVNRFRPSVDYLFESACAVKDLKKVAILITGMGCDRAKQMLELSKLGVQTIAQDKVSSVVWGMPGSAVGLGAAQHVTPLNKIAELLISLLNNKHK